MDHLYNCVLVVSLVLLQVLPAGADIKCMYIGGQCQNDNVDLACPAGYRSGLCDGGLHRRCCLPFADRFCAFRRGRCQYDGDYCAGGYRSGLCSGASDRRCCMPYADRYCHFVGGDCNYPSQCDSFHIQGFCGGGASRKCCISGTR